MKYYVGVDPSTVSTGFALVDENGHLVQYGTIRPGNDLNDQDKLKYQYEVLETMLRAYNVEGILCEDQFNGPNVDTLKKIARTASIIMLLAAQYSIELHMTYPASWRKSFHGSGKATKSDTIKLVNEMFGTGFKTKDNDITDAVGMAVACWKLHKEVQD